MLYKDVMQQMHFAHNFFSFLFSVAFKAYFAGQFETTFSFISI